MAGNISPPYFSIGAKFYKAPNIGIAASNFSGDRISEEREGERESSGPAFERDKQE